MKTLCKGTQWGLSVNPTINILLLGVVRTVAQQNFIGNQAACLRKSIPGSFRLYYV